MVLSVMQALQTVHSWLVGAADTTGEESGQQLASAAHEETSDCLIYCWLKSNSREVLVHVCS